VVTVEPWRRSAACAGVGPTIFFDPTPPNLRRARALCSRCSVAAECRGFADENDERHGLWGGATELERHVERNPEVRPGPEPLINDNKIVAVLNHADPNTLAVEILRRDCAVGRRTAYAAVARAMELALVERRGNGVFPIGPG
jgi:Transcription factor WhiB